MGRKPKLQPLSALTKAQAPSGLRKPSRIGQGATIKPKVAKANGDEMINAQAAPCKKCKSLKKVKKQVQEKTSELILTQDKLMMAENEA